MSDNVVVKNRFSPREAVISPQSPKGSGAQQNFKDDADINMIMRKFQKTGAIDHVAKYQPQYGLDNSHSLHESMNIIARANTMFEELPSSIRKKFENEPAAFLDYVQDPANGDEAKELGLALAPEAQAEYERLKELGQVEEAAATVEASGTPTSAPAVAEEPPNP